MKGKRFGTKTVIRESGRDRHGRARYMLRCDCGSELVVELFRLNQYHPERQRIRCKFCKTCD